MTGKKLLFFTFLQWVLLALIKVWFFKNQIFSNPGIQEIGFWILIFVIITALVRRFGHISFLEAFFIAVFWTLLNLFLDLLWVTPFTSTEIFFRRRYLSGAACLILAVMLFHKKRHIKIRHDLHAQHK